MNELFAPPESGLLSPIFECLWRMKTQGIGEHFQSAGFDRRYLKQHPEFTAYKVMEVVDDGHSGTNFDRPGIKRVLELVRQRKVAAILVKDLSRFARELQRGRELSGTGVSLSWGPFYICQRRL